MTWIIRSRAPLRVINYFPWYSSDPESREYDDYYRVKLILYYSFERLIDLLSLDEYNYGSYIDVFRAYKRLYTHPNDFYTDPIVNGRDTDSENGKSINN